MLLNEGRTNIYPLTQNSIKPGDILVCVYNIDFEPILNIGSQYRCKSSRFDKIYGDLYVILENQKMEFFSGRFKKLSDIRLSKLNDLIL